MYQATIEADDTAAETIELALEQALDPSPVAVGRFDVGKGRSEVFAHYHRAPSRDELIGLIERVAGSRGFGPIHIEEIADADWVRLSQGKRGPVKAGRFLLHGSHDRARVPRRRFTVEIDAGQAFGTAHHASTRGCLLALDDAIKRNRPRSVADIGTGTGILAIAAAKALQRPVLAGDSDPLAVKTAAENAKKNGVGPWSARSRPQA